MARRQAHLHVNGVAGGIAILPDGREDADYNRPARLRHGRHRGDSRKAPHAQGFAVKISRIRFPPPLSAWSGHPLVVAEWYAHHQSEPRYAELAQNCRLITAGENEGIRWLPVGLAGVLPAAEAP